MQQIDMINVKTFNRMSIEHILCSPNDQNQDFDDHTYYGLPSPVSSYDSNDEDFDYLHNDYHESVQPQRSHSVYQIRTILPYKRRRTHSSNSIGDRISTGQTRVPWTPDEDVLLKQGYEQGLSWAMIASTYLPHRSRGCCWGRFKTLKNKKFLNVQRQIRAKAKPWKTLNPLDMQQSLMQ
ncbi:hypothetical protein BC941DRAFT_474069 [Chlamydoabsidia padenii]|nr:hypothetical protein BC941DRAFT_474069 [Chlamydoabsidia padenii]